MIFRVPFFLHSLGNEEIESLREALKSPIITTGDVVARFEERFAAYTGSRFALGVTHATGALHLSALALGIGPGDEVITTPLTFIATAQAILHAGAKPVFVDVEPDTGNLDARKIEAAITPRTKAILPVHLYGLMCDMRAIREIAGGHGLKIIEDAAHCIEGQRDGVRPGELADTACFSFFATKNITCGEGGAVTCNSPELRDRLKLLRLHGMTANSADRFKQGYKHWDMVTLGWKYNMSNLQAALLEPQLSHIDSSLELRHRLAERYARQLSRLSGVSLPASPEGVRHARHLFTIQVDPGIRDRLIRELTEDGIAVTVNYRAIHQLTYFKETFGHDTGDFPIAERIGESTISLPFYPQMPPGHVDLVVESLEKALKRIRT